VTRWCCCPEGEPGHGIGCCSDLLLSAVARAPAHVPRCPVRLLATAGLRAAKRAGYRDRTVTALAMEALDPASEGQPVLPRRAVLPDPQRRTPAL
jgi:hypothetical protein